MMSDDEFAQAYRDVEDVLLERATSVNEACLDRIRQSVLGSSVLEVGAGRGYLAGILSKQHDVTAVDIVVSEKARADHPRVKFKEANIERLPFASRGFDTVVCMHTIENVKDIGAAVRELWRVTKRRWTDRGRGLLRGCGW